MSSFKRPVAFLLALPVLELIVLIYVGRHIGLWPTLLVLLASGFLGLLLIHVRGAAVWRRVKNELAAGCPPGGSLLDGLFTLAAGFLLIMPGLLTDVLALLLLLPAVRRAVGRRIAGWLGNHSGLWLFRWFPGNVD